MAGNCQACTCFFLVGLLWSESDTTSTCLIFLLLTQRVKWKWNEYKRASEMEMKRVQKSEWNLSGTSERKTSLTLFALEVPNSTLYTSYSLKQCYSNHSVKDKLGLMQEDTSKEGLDIVYIPPPLDYSPSPRYGPWFGPQSHRLFALSCFYPPKNLLIWLRRHQDPGSVLKKIIGWKETRNGYMSIETKHNIFYYLVYFWLSAPPLYLMFLAWLFD